MDISGRDAAENLTELPTESFLELAAEATRVANEKAAAAEACEITVASIEVKAEASLGAQIRYQGMRGSVATLKRRAILSGRTATLLKALAYREAEIRELIGRVAIGAP
jgi:hypothetical protein